MKGREKCCVWSVLGPRDEWSTVEKEEAGLKVMTKLVVEKFKLIGSAEEMRERIVPTEVMVDLSGPTHLFEEWLD